MKIAIASDHRGVLTKTRLVAALSAEGHEVEDLGTGTSDTSVDYPDFATAVARRVTTESTDRGILICGTGIGMAITANKIAGVRAAVCHTVEMAELCRQHNDANVLCLSGDFVDEAINVAIAKTFLSTEFEGGRHGRRISKIADLEARVAQ